MELQKKKDTTINVYYQHAKIFLISSTINVYYQHANIYFLSVRNRHIPKGNDMREIVHCNQHIVVVTIKRYNI